MARGLSFVFEGLAPGDRSKRRDLIIWFAVLFCAALIIRLGFVYRFGSTPVYDLLWNDAVGWNLASGNGFTASQVEPRVPGIYRTPGYPAFLAAVYSLFGHSYFAVYASQALLDALSAVLIGLIALNYVTPRTAIISSGLYALYPYSIYFCGILHQDILLTFSILVALFLLTKAIRSDERLRRWLMVGIAVGFAALVKTNMLLFAIVPAITLFWGIPRVQKRREAMAMLSLAIVLVISPWVVRNYVVFHGFPPLSVGGTGKALVLLVDELNGGEEQLLKQARGPQDEAASTYLEGSVDGTALIEREKGLARRAAPELLRRWPEYLVLMLKHVPRLWVTRYTIGRSAKVAMAAQLVSWAFLIPGLLGMFIARREWRGLLPLYATVVLFTVMYAPYNVEARYTLPARPVMAVFIGIALSQLVIIVRNLRRRPVLDPA